jgi:hypothetical protein
MTRKRNTRNWSNDQDRPYPIHKTPFPYFENFDSSDFDVSNQKGVLDRKIFTTDLTPILIILIQVWPRSITCYTFILVRLLQQILMKYVWSENLMHCDIENSKSAMFSSWWLFAEARLILSGNPSWVFSFAIVYCSSPFRRFSLSYHRIPIWMITREDVTAKPQC